ncbi:MAG: hypothetical protein JWL79_3068 [Frankiales bacterium]|nr:hypothetical protein [Frankiales bacterium]
MRLIVAAAEGVEEAGVLGLVIGDDELLDPEAELVDLAASLSRYGVVWLSRYGVVWLSLSR